MAPKLHPAPPSNGDKSNKRALISPLSVCLSVSSSALFVTVITFTTVLDRLSQRLRSGCGPIHGPRTVTIPSGFGSIPPHTVTH